MTDTRALFDLPENLIYLDGNSLGPLPHAAKTRMAQAVQGEWGGMLIGGWNTAGWMDQPARLGDKIAALIGAPKDSVVVGETLSIRIFQCLAAALRLRPDRRVILSDTGNFPSDLYVAQGLIDTLGQGHELRCVAPGDIAEALDTDVAALMLTEVDYRTGRRHDMAALTRRAQQMGAVVIWDLAHSAGAVPVELTASGAEFAAGCTYKYLNGGPGAPAFLYARPDIAQQAHVALAGWLGHAAPFEFLPDYRPGAGTTRFRIGTPPVLQMAALEAALEVFERRDLRALHARACALADRLSEGFTRICPRLRRQTPQALSERGSQISFTHPDGYAMVQALIDQGVVGDFRAPDILRFGIAPLYNTPDDIENAIAAFARVIENDLWRDPAFAKRKAVT